MGLKTVDIAAILLNLVYCVYSDDILPCSVTALHPCSGDHQICQERTRQCVCMEGFTMVDGSCIVPTPEEHTAHTATAVVVVIFTLVLLIFGVVLVFRKYNLMTYIRQKINMRRNNDVTYEDVMIGQDDPPLSP